MKMAQSTPDQNFYHQHTNPNSYPQLQLPQTFRNSSYLIFDERKGGINYNCFRPFISHEKRKTEDISHPLVTSQPARRTRTTFTNDQLFLLESYFLKSRYLTTTRLIELSEKLGLGTAQVKIWFKNRRRRAKLQLNHRNEFLYDDMSLSPPTTSNSSNTEINDGSLSSSGEQLNLTSASLNHSSGSSPNDLLPSSVSTKSTTNLITNYRESAFDSYYYNTHQASTNPAFAPLNHVYAESNMQYYPLLLPSTTFQHQQHQQQYHISHREDTSTAQNSVTNFDNPYNMPMPRSLTDNSAATAAQPTSMSPNSEDYEPLKQKYSKSSSQYNGIGSGHGDAIDDSNEIKTILRVLENNNINSNADICSSKNAVAYESYSNPAFNIMAKQCLKVASDPNDANYLRRMDTLMHAYNNRSLDQSSTQQLATFCFN